MINNIISLRLSRHDIFSIVVQHRTAFGQYSVAESEGVHIDSNIGTQKYFSELIYFTLNIYCLPHYHLKDVNDRDGKKRVTELDFND